MKRNKRRKEGVYVLQRKIHKRLDDGAVAVGGEKNQKANMTLCVWRKKKQLASTDDYTIFKFDFSSSQHDGDRCFVPLQNSGVGAFVEVPENIK